MSFGKRRPKLSRASLRPTNPISLQQGRLARQRDRLARFLIVCVAVLITAALVHGQGTPFTYRLGQTPNRDIHVNVPEFKRLNQKKTNAKRQEEIDLIAPSLINDAAPIKDLSDRLEDLIATISKAQDFNSLPETLRFNWKLTRETFDEIKAATDTPARAESLHRQILKAFAPLIQNGVLGYDTMPNTEETKVTLSVRPLDGKPGEARLVARERVVPERISKPDGEVATEFIAAFTEPRLGPAIFRLIADKLVATPTLTYDEADTTRLRDSAKNQVEEIYDTYKQGDLLVEQDQKITEEALILLRMEHDKSNEMLSLGARTRRMAAKCAASSGASTGSSSSRIEFHWPTSTSRCTDWRRSVSPARYTSRAAAGTSSPSSKK